MRGKQRDLGGQYVLAFRPLHLPAKGQEFVVEATTDALEWAEAVIRPMSSWQPPLLYDWPVLLQRK